MEPSFPVCFHLGVVAPSGFDLPDLEKRLWSRLLGMLQRRMFRKERIGFITICGEPISLAMTNLARERGWGCSSYVRHPERFRRVAHRAACAQVAVEADAVVVVHDQELEMDLRTLLEWCRWLGVQTRCLRLTRRRELS